MGQLPRLDSSTAPAAPQKQSLWTMREAPSDPKLKAQTMCVSAPATTQSAARSPFKTTPKATKGEGRQAQA